MALQYTRIRLIGRKWSAGRRVFVLVLAAWILFCSCLVLKDYSFILQQKLAILVLQARAFSQICHTGRPCQYKTEVDFRVMVLTYNRSDSLRRTLDSLANLDMMGDTLAVEIWVDRPIEGDPDPLTIKAANDWMSTWKYPNGMAQLHVQDKHAGIRNQWIYTWRPHVNSNREIGLLLEDDIDVSPYAYRWLKAVHREYGDCPSVSGYTLQMENVFLKAMGFQDKALQAPQSDSTFLYPVIGTWGYSPHPVKWRLFQDWYAKVIQQPGFHPYVDGIVSTQWFKDSEKGYTAENTWSIYHHYFNYVKHLYCVYSNLAAYTGRKDVLLSRNRQEKGLHFHGEIKIKDKDLLMRSWKDSYISFPGHAVQLHYNGTVAGLT